MLHIKCLANISYHYHQCHSSANKKKKKRNNNKSYLLLNYMPFCHDVISAGLCDTCIVSASFQSKCANSYSSSQ